MEQEEKRALIPSVHVVCIGKNKYSPSLVLKCILIIKIKFSVS
jgi:hypothetical protein